MLNTSKIIALARKHVHANPTMESSARACLSDAINCHDAGNLESAQLLAIKSLRYSVGIFHKDCQRAMAAVSRA